MYRWPGATESLKQLRKTKKQLRSVSRVPDQVQKMYTCLAPLLQAHLACNTWQLLLMTVLLCNRQVAFIVSSRILSQLHGRSVHALCEPTCSGRVSLTSDAAQCVGIALHPKSSHAGFGSKNHACLMDRSTFLFLDFPYVAHCAGPTHLPDRWWH